MRRSLPYLISIYFIIWIEASASLDLDYDAYNDFFSNADALLLDDTFLTSESPTGLVGGDGAWSVDAETNPNIFADASGPIDCLSETGQLQTTTSRRFRTRESCPINLFQANPSSHGDTNRKFLENLPIFTEPGALAGYKEPDPDRCPAELNGYFVYAICGSMGVAPGGEASDEENSSEEYPNGENSNEEGLMETIPMLSIPTGGININPCFPCTLFPNYSSEINA